MKLERVLTMEIVDNFVRFGMPYTRPERTLVSHNLVPRLSPRANEKRKAGRGLGTRLCRTHDTDFRPGPWTSSDTLVSYYV